MNQKLLPLVLLLAAGAVSAGSKTATVGMRVTIVSACELGRASENGSVSLGELHFGQYPSLRHPIRSSSTIQVKCAQGVTYKVSIDDGQNYGGSTVRGAPAGDRRRMAGPAKEMIAYEVFMDAAFATAWNKSSVFNGVGAGAVAKVPVYFRVPSQATPVAGVYRDVIRVTVEW